MALTFSNLIVNHDDGDAQNYVTASVSPTANRLELLTVTSYPQSGAAGPTGVTGNGLTWVQEGATIAGGNGDYETKWRAMGASPSSGAITITHGVTQFACAWSLDESSAEVDTTGTNGSGACLQSKTGAANTGGGGGDLTITLDNALGSPNNVTHGGFGANISTLSAGSGFTLLGSDSAGAAKTLSDYKTNSTTAVAHISAWTIGGIATEVKMAVAVAGTSDRHMPRGLRRGIARGLSNAREMVQDKINGLWLPKDRRLVVPVGVSLEGAH